MRMSVIARLRNRKRKCDPNCPGWAIFNEAEGRPSLQACDECNRLNARWKVSDRDVGQIQAAYGAWLDARARVQARRDAKVARKRIDDRERLAALAARKAGEKATKLAEVTSEIEGARYNATVALDAIDDEHPDRDAVVARLGGLYKLLALALADYKLRYPRARGDSLWVYRNQHAGVGDLHCRFCGGYLESVEMGRHIHAEVKGHTARCALLSLAGLLKPVAPGAAPRADDTCAAGI